MNSLRILIMSFARSKVQDVKGGRLYKRLAISLCKESSARKTTSIETSYIVNKDIHDTDHTRSQGGSEIK